MKQRKQKKQKKNVCRNGSFFVALKSKEVVGEVEPQKVQLKDVICFSCKGILYEPSVLNCGHVFCISCVLPTNGTSIKCKACGALHASAPKICLELNGFIETYFPSEYRSRVEQIQLYTGTSSFVQTMRDDAKPLEPKAQSAKLSETHVGVGCDSCGVYPIQGNRYSCQSCKDFDLCEKCSKMDCTIHGRSGQLHSVDHILELNDSYLFDKVLSVLDEKIKNAEGGDEGLREAEEDDDGEELREWQADTGDDDGEELREWQADTGGVNAGFFWH